MVKFVKLNFKYKMLYSITENCEKNWIFWAYVLNFWDNCSIPHPPAPHPPAPPPLAFYIVSDAILKQTVVLSQDSAHWKYIKLGLKWGINHYTKRTTWKRAFLKEKVAILLRQHKTFLDWKSRVQSMSLQNLQEFGEGEHCEITSFA